MQQKNKAVLDGALLRALREARGFSCQADLAKATGEIDRKGSGLSARIIWNAENGVPVTRRSQLLIAGALGMDNPEALFLELPAGNGAATPALPRKSVWTPPAPRIWSRPLVFISVALGAVALVFYFLLISPLPRLKSNDDSPDVAPQRTAQRGPISATAIELVTFSGRPYEYTVDVVGKGFGALRAQLPDKSHSEYFRIGDSTIGLEAGYGGPAGRDRFGLNYISWSDSRIKISGYELGAPGHCVVVGVWNPVTRVGAAWGGNIPPISLGTPRIRSVRAQADGTITLTGHGFGAAPASMPFTGNTNNLQVVDLKYHSFSGRGSVLFTAGLGSDAINLVYRSWSDNRIEIGGLAGNYADGGMSLSSGDPIAIVLVSTHSGLKTAWGGTVEK